MKIHHLSILSGIGLTIIGLLPHTGAYSMSKVPPKFTFTQHCAGRYQLELPADMKQTKASFSVADIGVKMRLHDKSANDGVLRGDDRLERWQAYVEAERLKDDKHYPTQYLFKEMNNPVKTLVFETDTRHLKRGKVDLTAWRSFSSYFFHDYPEQGLGIVIGKGGGRGNFEYSNQNYQAEFKQQLKKMLQEAERVVYAPWPHKLEGVCLNREFTYESALPDGESYLIKFHNGKKSSFNVEVDVYSKGSEQYLKQELDRYSGLMTFLASQSFKVMGRKGRLFISDGRYSDTQREFKWVSTDTKTDSIQYAHLVISGAIEIKDYPEFSRMNGTEVVVALLQSVQVRENGMLGVK